ncbi:MAG TPA: hypothetical protein VNZ67_06195 [bacterium]|jgi:hypothetical protein|nr:hypothetical protein [bacterium]
MPTVAVQTRLRWIQVQGKEVLHMDFSRAVPEESLALIAAFHQAMLGRAADSVLLLTDVTEAVYEASIARQWKAARMEHSRAIRASAIFGLRGLVGAAVRGFIDAARLLGLSFVDQRLRIFTSEAEACDWLGQQ